jgi:transcriptional antiterminator NusG
MKLVDPSKAWYVAMPRANQDEKAARAVEESGFAVYLPRRKIERKDRRTNVIKEIVKPVHPGYFYVGFTSFARHFEMVRKCDGVFDFIKVAGEPIPVPALAVAEIQSAEMNYAFDDTRKARIHRGEEERSRKENIRKRFPEGAHTEVVDETHPFANFPAVVDEVTSSGSIKALIDLFGRAVSVEFEEKQLKPAA